MHANKFIYQIGEKGKQDYIRLYIYWTSFQWTEQDNNYYEGLKLRSK